MQLSTTFVLLLLVVLIVLFVIFLVWDSSQMTKRAENGAKASRSQPFPARPIRANERGGVVGFGDGGGSFGHDSCDGHGGGDGCGGDGGGGGH
jgi:hypothetical protein